MGKNPFFLFHVQWWLLDQSPNDERLLTRPADLLKSKLGLETALPLGQMYRNKRLLTAEGDFRRGAFTLKQARSLLRPSSWSTVLPALGKTGRFWPPQSYLFDGIALHQGPSSLSDLNRRELQRCAGFGQNCRSGREEKDCRVLFGSVGIAESHLLAWTGGPEASGGAVAASQCIKGVPVPETRQRPGHLNSQGDLPIRPWSLPPEHYIRKLH